MASTLNIRVLLSVALTALLVLSSAKAVISIDFFEHLTDNMEYQYNNNNWLIEDPKTSLGQPPQMMVVKADEGFVAESPNNNGFAGLGGPPKATSEKDKLYAIFHSI
jgi:hypothetical protein